MESQFIKSKAKKISKYDPNKIYKNYGLFGLPYDTDEANVVILPVPWEVTASFKDGAAEGPKAIEKVSYQVDLYDEDINDGWKAGIAMEPISKYWQQKNNALRRLAKKCIRHIEAGGQPSDKEVRPMYDKINTASRELNNWLKEESLKWLGEDKIVGVLGGDHSSPLGLMQALGVKYEHYSIIHFDAHADYRDCYEGFEYSHASIQNNAGKIPAVEKQVLVGIRDFSEHEAKTIKNSKGKIVSITDRRIKQNLYKGTTWEDQCKEITKNLGDNVYISFDIDSLNPAMCPHTGTPVPSGLEYEHVFFLLDMLAKEGKKIIGFDLCEVAPGNFDSDNTDAIVGAKILYRLSLIAAKSQSKI